MMETMMTQSLPPPELALPKAPVEVPEGTVNITAILPANVIGFIIANPQAEQVRGYIRNYAQLILTPEAQLLLGDGGQILGWTRVHWTRKNQAQAAKLAAIAANSLMQPSLPAIPGPPGGDYVVMEDIALTEREDGVTVRYNDYYGSMRIPRSICLQGEDAVIRYVKENYTSLGDPEYGDESTSWTDSEVEEFREPCVNDWLLEQGFDPGGGELPADDEENQN